MVRAWGQPVLMVLVGVLVGVVTGVGGSAAGGVVAGTVLVAMGAVISPVVFPRAVSAREARLRSAEDGRPVVYWRPGCVYCLRLRFRLGRRAREAHWVDIWRDPEGAAAVREVNGGNETVPTVFYAGTPHTNPDPAWVRERLSA
jgi:glutaredoxin